MILPTTSSSASYAVRGPGPNGRCVEAWSNSKLQFEPKGELADFRQELRAAIGTLKTKCGELVHGTYVSASTESCDAENVLIYNVGPSSFAQRAGCGIRFERAFARPPQPPADLDDARHYQRYVAVRLGVGFESWHEGGLLGLWSDIPCPPLTEFTKPAAIWHALKQGDVEVEQPLGAPPPRIGLRVRLKVPACADPAPAAIIKPIFDGVIAGFHAHAHPTSTAEMARRLSESLAIDPALIAQRLTGPERAVLGTRRLLWARSDGVQWNPADELCVAGELQLVATQQESAWTLSGELFEVIEGGVGSAGDARR
jgi:hypothetical protein